LLVCLAEKKEKDIRFLPTKEKNALERTDIRRSSISSPDFFSPANCRV
jgi:hypothetical protein